ncbi:MAG: S41 family peptidase [Chitinophagaceae bacterium]
MNNKKLQVWFPLFFSLSMLIGIFLGYKLHGNMPASRNIFQAGGRSTLQEVFELIRTRYVDEVSLDTLGQSAIEQMLTQLDPHSVYIPARELNGVNEDLAGRFEGIGVEFNIFEDTVHVLTVLKDGPSDKAGLLPGDRFLRVGDSVVAGKGISSDGIRNLLRGPRGTEVSVTVMRVNEQKPFKITRGFIPIYSLDAAYMLNEVTGIIRLNKFSETTYEEFMASLEKLQKQGLKELILDLRDNGGGIMDEAVEIADEFIDGNKLIVYTEGNHTARKEYTCRRNGLFEKGKLILLMNEGSASASEVLAGALQDWDRATIIGRRSFGKGLVQEQYNLRDGSALRLTVARYYSPLGRSIQKSYTGGIEKYNEEILDRYHDGKMSNADSNINTNGKVYTTADGKKLYGGGGISPDVFVPLDTLLIDTSLAPLFTRNTMGNFAYRYYITHKTKFDQYKTASEFNKSYVVDDVVLDELFAFARKDSIQLKPLNAANKDRLRLRVKSLLARQQWRNEGFFEVANRDDKMIQKALEEVKN